MAVGRIGVDGVSWGAVGMSCCTAPTAPSLPMLLTVIFWPGYEAANNQRPVASVSMLAMLSASGASPSLRSLPLAGSIARLTTRNGCERSATYSTFLSGLTAMGMAIPPSAVVSTGFKAPALRSSSNTDTSWLSALDT